MVPHLIRKIDKNIIEMGLYGSIWVDIEGIRSHGCYKGSDIPNRDLICYIILDLDLNVCLDNSREKKSKNMHAPEVGAGDQNS